MSDNRKISIADIIVGQPLRWNVMDEGGNLLLSKGYVIERQSTAEALVARGTYIDAASEDGRDTATEAVGDDAPSVIRTINQVVSRLGPLLMEIGKYPDARGRILFLVRQVRDAIKLSPDLAIATVQINQKSGKYDCRHCVDVAIVAALVAEAMNKNNQEIQDIVAASLTMNISMASSHAILQGRKGELSDQERINIRNHPLDSTEILFDAGIEDANWLFYILMHHEKEDGTGYPVGGTLREIPENAKIITIADGFCARISSRGYRRSVLPSIAIRDIFIENRDHVDPTLAKYFIKVLGLYPPGTFVKLKSGEVAIITHSGATPSTNVAYSLVNQNNVVYGNPFKRDTGDENYAIVEAIHPIQASVSVQLQQVWGALAAL